MEKKYIRKTEVAEMFGVSYQTITNWEKKGILSGFMLGGIKCFDYQTVKEKENSLFSAMEMEKNLKRYKRSLKESEDAYKKSINELRDCCDDNKALAESKRLLVKVFPSLCEVIRDNSDDRRSRMLQMLLDGDDIRKIADFFKLTAERVRQIVNVEVERLVEDAESYRELKEERDRLAKEVEVLRINARSLTSVHEKFKVVDGVRVSALSKKISDCELSVRAKNCCDYVGIETVADLVCYKRKEIMRIRNLGKTTMGELDWLVRSFGLEWGKCYILYEDGTVAGASSEL